MTFERTCSDRLTGLAWWLNLSAAVLLAAAGFALWPRTPAAVLPLSAGDTRDLAVLEDWFVRAPSNGAVATALWDRYLDLDRPGLVIAGFSRGDPSLAEDPRLAHRLARAYEASGRLLDALATSELALARCARFLGTSRASLTTPVPAYACDEHQMALLDVHHSALARMIEMGISDPATDSRTGRAYDSALRRAWIVSAR